MLCHTDNRASPAISGLAYSGVISAYTALSVLLKHRSTADCHESSFNVDKIRESFLAMLTLLFFEAFILTVSGRHLLCRDLEEYIDRMDDATTCIFGLYLDSTRFSEVRRELRDDTRQRVEGLLAEIDVIRDEARQHLLQAREEPDYGSEPFPGQQWTAFVNALFGAQNHLTAMFGAMKAAEADRNKYKEWYARVAGEGGPSYERLGSERESDRNPLLIADDAMFATFQELHRCMKGITKAMRRLMQQATYTEQDLAVDKPIHFEELVESLAAGFQECLEAAHDRQLGKTGPDSGPVYPNQKVCANYMVHRSLRNITTEFYRMEVAVCGLATVAASIYINPGSADPSLAQQGTYGNKRCF